MQTISRKEAKSKGLVMYYTGKPCVNGHLSPKYTGSGSCAECIKSKSKNRDTSIDDLRNFLSYNPENGNFTWKPREGSESFNTLRAGTLAGNVISPKGSRTKYLRLRVDNVLHLAHRVAWAIYYGEWPKGQIDHIDGNGLNNAIENLRDVENKANIRNCRLSKNNSTGVNGVWQQGNSYVAEIMVDRKKISLGSYRTLDEAKAARKAADRIYGFYETHGDVK